MQISGAHPHDEPTRVTMPATFRSRIWRAPAPHGIDAQLASLCLRPLASLFALGVRTRDHAYHIGLARTTAVSAPVISVGGIEVGGVGKTPLVAALAGLASRNGRAVAVLSRGYGGVGGGTPTRVELPIPTNGAERFGDEPCLLAERLGPEVQLWVGADRVRAAHAAIERGAELLFLDDGFQHRRLARDADIVTLSGAEPLANARMLPAGPLREPPMALRRATRVVLADPPDSQAAARALERVLGGRAELHAWRARPSLHAVRGEAASEQPVHLLTGIAHPERVERALESIGVASRGHSVFDDHHVFSPREIDDVILRASGAAIVTTEKDWMRLRPLQERFSRLSVLRLELEWIPPSSEANWVAWIERIVEQARETKGRARHGG